MLGRLRQRLFDILQDGIVGRVFADLYAGTGAVGIEALSRGAGQSIFVESNPRAAAVIRSNLSALALQDRARVRVCRVRSIVGRVRADVFFLGPPYAEHREYSRTMAALQGKASDWVIAQHGRDLRLRDRYGSLEKVRIVRAGNSRLSLYRPA